MLYKCSAKVVSEIISVIMDKGAYWCKMSCKCYWRVPLWIKPCHFTRQLNKCHKLPVPLWHCERPCGTLMRCVTSQLFSHGGTFHHNPPPPVLFLGAAGVTHRAVLAVHIDGLSFSLSVRGELDGINKSLSGRLSPVTPSQLHLVWLWN